MSKTKEHLEYSRQFAFLLALRSNNLGNHRTQGWTILGLRANISQAPHRRRWTWSSHWASEVTRGIQGEPNKIGCRGRLANSTSCIGFLSDIQISGCTSRRKHENNLDLNSSSSPLLILCPSHKMNGQDRTIGSHLDHTGSGLHLGLGYYSTNGSHGISEQRSGKA